MMAAEIQTSFPFEVFEEEIIASPRGVTLGGTEEFVAGLLLEATSERPIRIAEISAAIRRALLINVNDREIKSIVRSLRRDHAFPICSRKGKPAGYYWARSAKELEEFVQGWKSQYLDEATTLHRILKANVPRLAGQMRLELASEEEVG